jgi:hypothetical protein
LWKVRNEDSNLSATYKTFFGRWFERRMRIAWFVRGDKACQLSAGASIRWFECRAWVVCGILREIYLRQNRIILDIEYLKVK